MRLTEDERVKLADYLEFEANANDGLAKQMDTLPSGPMQAMAKKYRTEAAAMLMVAARLRATELWSAR